MVGIDMKDYRAPRRYRGWREFATALFLCSLFWALLIGAWIVGDELQQCRLMDAPSESFGTGRE